MSRQLQTVKFKFHSDALWRGRMAALYQILDANESFRPLRWGFSEPVRRRFAPEALPEMEKLWDRLHGLMFTRPKKPRYWMDSMWTTHNLHGPASGLWGGIEAHFFKRQENIEAFLAFARDIFEWGEMLHGFACHQLDYKVKNRYQRIEDWGGGMKMLAEGAWGTDLYKCLPGVYWANFFSGLFVEWFGRERVRSAPCYRQEELPNGGILILTASSPLGYDKSEVKELERALVAHLGPEIFFDRSDPERPCKTPPFPKRGKGKLPKVIIS